MIVFDRRGAAIVAAIVVAIGALPIYAGASRICEYIASPGAEFTASADVVSAERLWLRELISPFRKRDIWALTYEFKAAGGAVVRSTGIYTQSSAIAKPAPGTKLRVRYNPADPGSIYLEDDHRLFDAAIYIGIGLFLWLIAGVLAALGFRARQRLLPP